MLYELKEATIMIRFETLNLSTHKSSLSSPTPLHLRYNVNFMHITKPQCLAELCIGRRGEEIKWNDNLLSTVVAWDWRARM